MNILTQDPFDVAIVIVDKVIRFKSNQFVYVNAEGRVRLQRTSRPGVVGVPDRDLVGCYTKATDPKDLEMDLIERMKEIMR